jgi:hypothetical protein
MNSKKSNVDRTDNRVDNLYAAENHELPYGVKFLNMEEVQNFVDLVTGSPEWNAMGNVPCHVRVFDWGESCSSEAREPNEIWLARKHFDTQVVLHELAHLVIPKAKHGPEWVRVYLLLIHYFMGSHYVALYTKAFKRVGVKV